MLKRLHYVINCQKVRNMPCSLMGPVTLWESNGSGRLLYGVLYDELQKLLKERMNRDNLQKWRPSSSTSTLTLEWWQMPCGNGYSNGSRTAGSTEENSSESLHCGKVLLPR